MMPVEGAPFWSYELAFAILLVLGIAFSRAAIIAHRSVPDGLDQRVLAWVVAHRGGAPIVTTAARIATHFGDPVIATSLTLLIALVPLVWHRRGPLQLKRREALFWLGVIVGGRLLDMLLKELFQRERPPAALRLVRETSFSFPSGHSVFAAVFFTMLTIMIARAIPAAHRRWRLAAALVCLGLAAIVAASRVWLAVHFLSDVIGGYVLGVAWVVSAWTLRIGFQGWRQRRSSRTT